MTGKPFREMTNDELRAAHTEWAEKVRTAPGWSSVYFAAECLDAICRIGRERRLALPNPYPIKAGG